MTFIGAGVTLPSMTRILPWLALTFVTLMASGVYAVIKYMNSFVGPSEVHILRFLPASIVSIIALLTIYRKDLRQVIRRFWWFFLIREALAVLGVHFTLIYAETVLPAGIAALIVGIWPVITFFIAYLLIGESITYKKILGGIVAFAGVALVIVFGAEEEAGRYNITTYQWLKYSLILLIAPLSAATVTTISRWYLSRIDEEKLPDPVFFTFLCRAPAGIFTIIAYLIFHSSPSLTEVIPDLPPLFWVFVLVLSFYNSLIGFWIWNWALQKLPAGNVASFNYVQTLLAVVVAWLFLGESITMLKIIGGVTIVAGVFLVNFDKWSEEKLTERVKAKLPVQPGN